MFGFRSARGRVALTGAVFVLLLAAVVALAVWRAHDDRERHRSLQRRSTVVAALEDARVQSYLVGSWAAIVAVADALDAISSDRPYRPRRSVNAAMQEIVACSGKQFGPRVVQALVRLHKRKTLPYPRQHPPEEKAVA